MAKLTVLQPPHPFLRRKTQTVTKFDSKLQILIDDMIETMREAPGVGLAAPQIGELLCLAVIETPPKEDKDGNDIPNSRELFVIVNPEIVWFSHTLVDGIEGCLSIPGYLGEVTRYETVRVKAQDRHGKPVKYMLKGWASRIFQHEIDHLNGILYTDKLTSPKNFWAEAEFEERFKEKDTDKKKKRV